LETETKSFYNLTEVRASDKKKPINLRKHHSKQSRKISRKEDHVYRGSRERLPFEMSMQKNQVTPVSKEKEVTGTKNKNDSPPRVGTGPAAGEGISLHESIGIKCNENTFRAGILGQIIYGV